MLVLLFVTVPVFLVAALLLVRTIKGLVRTVRASRVAAVPLAPEARVRLETTGPLQLAMEGRRFSRDFAGVTFTLHRVDVGQEVPMRRLLFRTRVSGMDRVRLSLYALDVPAPGEYYLRAESLGAVAADSAVVFVRPLGAALVGYVLALIGLGALLIGSILVTALAVALVIWPWHLPGL
jgi:hypothetical protein